MKLDRTRNALSLSWRHCSGACPVAFGAILLFWTRASHGFATLPCPDGFALRFGHIALMAWNGHRREHTTHCAHAAQV